ncbi:hypothetical protein FN846DRAFT_202096 [Sphaerosporella brunnea]|uniref:Uncharacterized protein n=1 Tax=Sphaerosporella brunnea TaxID=1250544 RepID=A0A5J5F880_9PEZI|nr:hypothetical protein FN846DRAFT_202096 [Sphaerosporella brunnea]
MHASTQAGNFCNFWDCTCFSRPPPPAWVGETGRRVDFPKAPQRHAIRAKRKLHSRGIYSIHSTIDTHSTTQRIRDCRPAESCSSSSSSAASPSSSPMATANNSKQTHAPPPARCGGRSKRSSLASRSLTGDPPSPPRLADADRPELVRPRAPALSFLGGGKCRYATACMSSGREHPGIHAELAMPRGKGSKAPRTSSPHQTCGPVHGRVQTVMWAAVCPRSPNPDRCTARVCRVSCACSLPQHGSHGVPGTAPSDVHSVTAYPVMDIDWRTCWLAHAHANRVTASEPAKPTQRIASHCPCIVHAH